MYRVPLVPDDFDVPLRLETERLRLRPLLTSDAVKDYDAVMTSAERLQTVFREGGSWPDGLTLEQNLKELAWHEIEFQKRRSFAYTVVSLDESRILGCLYLHPTGRGLDRRGLAVRQARLSGPGNRLVGLGGSAGNLTPHRLS
jgi:RimJ/RimL family protein N-acetyltransferase